MKTLFCTDTRPMITVDRIVSKSPQNGMYMFRICMGDMLGLKVERERFIDECKRRGYVVKEE